MKDSFRWKEGLVAAFFLFSATVLYAATEIRSSAFQAFPVLGVGLGARAAALGESYVSLAEDPTAVFWNTGGLGRIRTSRFHFSHFRFAVDGYQQSIVAALPLKNLGTVAPEIHYRYYGTFEGRDGAGTPTGVFAPYDIVAAISFGFPIGGKCSAGVRSLWFRQMASGFKESGLVEDLGLLAGPYAGFRAGATLKNVGLDTSGHELPLEWKVGLSKSAAFGKAAAHRFLAALGTDIRPHNGSRLNGGLEYGYKEVAYLRGGWVHNQVDNELGKLQGLTAGLGLKWEEWSLDYALSSQGDLGWEHRFSLDMALSKKAQSAPVATSPTPTATVTALPGPNPTATPMTMDSGQPTPATGGAVPTPAPGTAVVLKFTQVDVGEAALTAEELYLKGEAERVQGRVDESLRLYLLCVEKDPRHDRAWTRIGQVQYVKSLEAVQKALEARPDNPALRLWLEKQKAR